MSVFVDTSGFYAVLDADDEHHPAAKTAWVQLLEDGASLLTSNYVLLETLALLQSRIGMAGVNRFTADITPVFETFWVDQEAHLSAHHSLLIAARRRLSLVDCVSFEVMRRLRIDRVFCFDPHFAEQGFEVIPDAHTDP